MPRALALRYLDVPNERRPAYLARLAERVASARAAAFHLWAFEAEGAPGRFVEFIETGDRAALATALLHDDLLAEALDVRHEPSNAQGSPPWELFVGVADG